MLQAAGSRAHSGKDLRCVEEKVVYRATNQLGVELHLLTEPEVTYSRHQK